jgi:hypothetical protein
MIRKGEPWGSSASGRPDLEVEGGDVDLARSVARDDAAPLVEYRPSPDADLARAIGLTRGSPGTTELMIDALDVAGTAAVNAAVLGVAPDRASRWTRRHQLEVVIDGGPAWKGSATGVVVANGQFVRGFDVVPRGHPGDGRLEVQVYALEPGERAEMRRRLTTGTHVPHPHILERSGRVVEIEATVDLPVEIDGVARSRQRHLRVAVLPGALRILV